MPKILFMVSTLKQSGTTIQFYYIAKYMQSNKYDLHAITLSPEEEGSMFERFHDLNINIQSLNLSRIGGFFHGKSKMRKMVDEIKPDVIHTQGIRSDAYSLMLAKKYQVVSSMQNYPFYDYPMLYGSFKGNLMAKKQLAVIKKRQNIIACSKSVADDFKKHHNVALDVIQNGVDTEIFYPLTNEDKLRVRQKLGLHQDKKIFISVGALITRKDMETVIQGFRESGIEDTHLLIAGGGDAYNDLLELAVENDNISLLGNVSDVPEYMQASDYFISASWAEGLPNTVLEAMACKLPVLLSSIKSHKEVFENFSDYPYFFNIRDYSGLAREIRAIILDNYVELAQKMLIIIEGNFTARIMSDKYQKLYDRLVKSSD